jgi:hypothetical protein
VTIQTRTSTAVITSTVSDAERPSCECSAVTEPFKLHARNNFLLCALALCSRLHLQFVPGVKPLQMWILTPTPTNILAHMFILLLCHVLGCTCSSCRAWSCCRCGSSARGRTASTATARSRCVTFLPLFVICFLLPLLLPLLYIVFPLCHYATCCLCGGKRLGGMLQYSLRKPRYIVLQEYTCSNCCCLLFHIQCCGSSAGWGVASVATGKRRCVTLLLGSAQCLFSAPRLYPYCALAPACTYMSIHAHIHAGLCDLNATLKGCATRQRNCCSWHTTGVNARIVMALAHLHPLVYACSYTR